MDSSPTIAIVGRPNVGKSSLFNRLIKKRHAVISDIAGTTRDRITQKFNFHDYEVLLVDTGGIEYGKKENIEADVQSQAKIAIEEADIILFVVNITENLTVDDFAAAEILRKSEKQVILIANKCDHKDLETHSFNFFELGFGEPITISAIHNFGFDVLENTILKKIKDLKFKKNPKKVKNENIINISIVGRPNAGKSSLVNALTGNKQLIVSDVPGTTRDATDTEIKIDEKIYNLIDTAGIRRPGKRGKGIEKFSVLRCFNSIEKSDVAILLIDGSERISSQDTQIARYVLEAEKGLIIAVNKIDLFEQGEDERNRVINILRKKFVFVPWAPVIFISAKNKKNIKNIFGIVKKIVSERKKKIKTADLNDYMKNVTYKHLPASRKIKKPKFLFINQVDTEPPKFLFYFKNVKNLHFSYPRYLENKIREKFGFDGTAINLKFKEKIINSKKPYQ